MPCCKAIKNSSLRKPSGYPKKIDCLSAHIKAKRLDLGLKQSELATQLKVSEATVSNWELNRKRIAPLMYKRISVFLGFCPVELPCHLLPNRLKNILYFDLGWTTTRLARTLGHARSTIEKYQSGIFNPSVKTIRKLESIVGYPIIFQGNEVRDTIGNLELPDCLPYRIGSHLLQKRIKNSQAVRDVSVVLRITPGTYRMWERNQCTPETKYFPQIMAYLGYCPIPDKLSDSSKFYLTRVYLNGYTKTQQAKIEGTSMSSIAKREPEIS